MPSTFLRPELLWGLTAVTLPILIHLLGRRRVRTVSIATLRFLERARSRPASRWRFRRLLLLLVRALTVACLAVLFAGPGCRDETGSAGPSNWVLLLDTSPSMGAGPARGPSALSRAKARLEALVASAGPADRFLLATTRAGDEEPWRAGFSPEATAVRKRIREARLEFGSHRVERALERAFRLLEGMEGAKVALATDLQASAWSPERVAGRGRASVTVLDVGLPEPKNAWVDSVREVPGGFKATLSAMGAPADGARRTIRLRLSDGQNATAFAAGTESSFQVRSPSRTYSGAVRVDPGGDLSLDDELAFAGRGDAVTQVLLVNGDPHAVALRDELFFVRRALAPGGKLGRIFRAREVAAVDLGPRELEGVDVILLTNPGALAAPVVAALRARVEAGAGLVVSAGDRLARDGAGAVAPLLPAPLRGVVSVAPQGPTGRPYEPVDRESLLGPLAAFRDRSAGDLTGTRVWSYSVLDARSTPGGVLLRLENGAPLLTETRLGKGRSLFLGTTLDRDGADLCLQPVFLPWLERVLLHAAGRLEPHASSPVTAGLPTVLPYRVPIRVEGPDGVKEPWQPGASFVPRVPGLYRVFGPEGEIDAFAARLDPAESDLRRLTPDAVRARLGEGGPGGSARSRRAGRRDLSGIFAWALLLLLAGEALLSARAPLRAEARGAAGGSGG